MQNRYGELITLKKNDGFKSVLNMSRRNPRDPNETITYAIDVSPQCENKLKVAPGRVVANLQWGRDGGSNEATFDIGTGRRLQVSASNIQLSVCYLPSDDDPAPVDEPSEVSVGATASWGSNSPRSLDTLTLTLLAIIADGDTFLFDVPPFATSCKLFLSGATIPGFNVAALPTPTIVYPGVSLSPTPFVFPIERGQRFVRVINGSGATRRVYATFVIGI